MRRIAMEEAFSVPELDTKVNSMRGNPFYQAEAVEHWISRLPDFTEWRLPDMDRYGIDIQVLSLTAPGVQAVSDPAAAIDMARRANDALASNVARHPDRFVGLAALPLQDPDAAVEELRRAVDELGLCGALVNGHTQGIYLDDPRMRPVWAALEELDVPLYLHPGAPPRDQWEVLQGYPYLAGPSWHWTAETAAHALRLVYGRVFDDHPGARLILGHMGELLPFQLARLDARYEFMTLEIPLRQLPSAYFSSNILITTTGVCSPAALVGAILAIGADRILFGVDYPFERTNVAVDFLDQAPLSPADRARIAHGNAERELKIPSR
jgi:2,3-dihydroxybenzoate decarboxylase